MKKNIIFLLTILCLTACENNSKGDRQSDPFYTEKGGFDFGRIPLIKPYEITNSSRGSYWVVGSADTSYMPLNIPGIRYVNVLDSAVFIYGQNTILDGQPVDAAWFVIIPQKQMSHGFIDHHAYLDYVHSMGLNKEPKLYDAQEVFQYFDKNDTVNWKGISTSLKAVN